MEQRGGGWEIHGWPSFSGIMNGVHCVRWRHPKSSLGFRANIMVPETRT